jgi:hypothetical protein
MACVWALFAAESRLPRVGDALARVCFRFAPQFMEDLSADFASADLYTVFAQRPLKFTMMFFLYRISHLKFKKM